ncbi:YciI family protein [Nocardia crassostreae]|uniref:YciI family protein n=1 Tax=Nocardia crassostreae TaxID=53428 RepID=UPI00082A7F96|nr:YciI family protein [Nocardia crassostreae]
MSKYLALIFEDARWEHPEPDELDRVIQEHTRFGEKNHTAILGGEALAWRTTATSIRPDGGSGFLVTDGPFVETKENLGGYYLVEAPDLDAAIDLAKQIPMPPGCGVELRPIREFG